MGHSVLGHCVSRKELGTMIDDEWYIECWMPYGAYESRDLHESKIYKEYTIRVCLCCALVLL